MTDKTTLIYIHDPMCSWCWGFRPTLDALRRQLPATIRFERLLGGLARDSDQPMAPEMQKNLQDTWRRIQQRIPGTDFNFDFWRDARPRRSTWPACRAVIAARSLETVQEGPMILAIQRAYYLEAQNPSDESTLTALAVDLGLDRAAFLEELRAPRTQQRLDDEIARARGMGADSFPSMRLQTGSSTWPLAVDYTSATAMLETIDMLIDS